MTTKHPITQLPKHPKNSSVVYFEEADSTRGEEEFWVNGDDSEPATVHQEIITGRPCDLEERTARFGEAIIRFAKEIPRGPGNNRLIDQPEMKSRAAKNVNHLDNATESPWVFGSLDISVFRKLNQP